MRKGELATGSEVDYEDGVFPLIELEECLSDLRQPLRSAIDSIEQPGCGEAHGGTLAYVDSVVRPGARPLLEMLKVLEDSLREPFTPEMKTHLDKERALHREYMRAVRGLPH